MSSAGESSSPLRGISAFVSWFLSRSRLGHWQPSLWTSRRLGIVLHFTKVHSILLCYSMFNGLVYLTHTSISPPIRSFISLIDSSIIIIIKQIKYLKWILVWSFSGPRAYSCNWLEEINFNQLHELSISFQWKKSRRRFNGPLPDLPPPQPVPDGTKRSTTSCEFHCLP